MKKKNIIDDISFKMMCVENKADEFKIIDIIEAIEDINMVGRDGRTLLIHAAAYNCENVLKRLLDIGADIRFQDSIGYTALHAAVKCKNINIAKILLSNGADINATNKYGGTVLSMPSPMNVDLIKFLLDNGADPHIKNNSGITPYESFSNYPDIIRLMDEVGGK